MHRPASLAEAVAASGTTPALSPKRHRRVRRPPVPEPATSTPQPGESLLAKVTIAWEAEATHAAVAAGSRVVVLRTGLVLDRKAVR